MLDIDGVIRVGGQVLPEMLSVLDQARASGILVTVATGRGYLRAREALGGFEPNAPLLIEDGARLTTLQGADLEFHPVEAQTIQALRSVLTKQPVRFAGFCPRDAKTYKFFLRASAVEFVRAHFGQIVDETTADVDTFLEWATTLGCAKITIQSEPGTTLAFPDGVEQTRNVGLYNVNPFGVNKGSGVRALAVRLGVQLTDVLVAGNDWNDCHMFRLAAGVRVAVGTEVAELLSLATHHVVDPTQLPVLLRSFLAAK